MTVSSFTQVGGAHWLSEAPAATVDLGAAGGAAAEEAGGYRSSGGAASSEGSIACNVVYTGGLLLPLPLLSICSSALRPVFELRYD